MPDLEVPRTESANLLAQESRSAAVTGLSAPTSTAEASSNAHSSARCACAIWPADFSSDRQSDADVPHMGGGAFDMKDAARANPAS